MTPSTHTKPGVSLQHVGMPVTALSTLLGNANLFPKYLNQFIFQLLHISGAADIFKNTFFFWSIWVRDVISAINLCSPDI